MGDPRRGHSLGLVLEILVTLLPFALLYSGVTVVFGYGWGLTVVGAAALWDVRSPTVRGRKGP